MKRTYQKLMLIAFAALAATAFIGSNAHALGIQIDALSSVTFEELGSKTTFFPYQANMSCSSANECVVSNFTLPSVPRGFGSSFEIEFYTGGSTPVPAGGQGGNWSSFGSFTLFRNPGTGLVTSSNIVARVLRSPDFLTPGEIFDFVLTTGGTPSDPTPDPLPNPLDPSDPLNFLYPDTSWFAGGAIPDRCLDSDSGTGNLVDGTIPTGSNFDFTLGSVGRLAAVGCYRGEDSYELFPETPLLLSLNVSVVATPEPATAALMGAGLLGLAWQGRRRRA